nr:energy transducer TonB [uncultured Brumimicrobium sp.]
MKKLVLILLLSASFFVFSQEKQNETLPMFPGGEIAMKKYLAEHLIYPEISMSNGDSGTVYVRFSINPDGFIGDVEILRGVSAEINKEVIRFINNMPKWIPAEDNTEKVFAVIPIHFRLQ